MNMLQADPGIIARKRTRAGIAGCLCALASIVLMWLSAIFPFVAGFGYHSMAVVFIGMLLAAGLGRMSGVFTRKEKRLSRAVWKATPPAPVGAKDPSRTFAPSVLPQERIAHVLTRPEPGSWISFAFLEIVGAFITIFFWMIFWPVGLAMGLLTVLGVAREVSKRKQARLDAPEKERIVDRLESEREYFGVGDDWPTVFVIHSDADAFATDVFNELTPALYAKGFNVVQYIDFNWPTMGMTTKPTPGGVDLRMEPNPDAVLLAEFVVLLQGAELGLSVEAELEAAAELKLPVLRALLPGSGEGPNVAYEIDRLDWSADRTTDSAGVAESIAERALQAWRPAASQRLERATD